MDVFKLGHYIDGYDKKIEKASIKSETPNQSDD